MAKKSKLSKELQERAKAWTKDIVQKANASNKPAHIVVSGRTYIKSDNIEMKISARSPQGDARAYEYGSGIHSRLPNVSPMQQGSRGFITIKPKRAKLLAFPWDTMNQTWEIYGEEAVKEALQYSHKFVGFSDETDDFGYPKYLFRYVDHPGVEAANGGKGYIGPAVTSVRAKIRKEVPASIRKHVIFDIQRIFRKTKDDI